MRPRVVFAGHTRYDLPLSPSLARKWDAVSARLHVRVIGSAGSTRETDEDAVDDRFRLFRFPNSRPLEGLAFYASLPVLAAAEIRSLRPHAIVAQSPYEGISLLPLLRALGRRRPRLIVEVHGDWRTAATLYGSSRRRALSPVANRAAATALQHADATRALTGYTARLAQEATGRSPIAVFPTYFDLHSFSREPRVPLPETPSVLWVGVLERYKNPAGFANAWRAVAQRVPEVRLRMVGQGPLEEVVRSLMREFPERVDYDRRLEPHALAKRYDEATLLALPSRSEGMGRVILEAFTRGRPVVATDVGGIRDLVCTGHNGVLVRSGDDNALADAMIAVLTDRRYASSLAAGAAADSLQHQWTAERYADAVAMMVERTLQRNQP